MGRKDRCKENGNILIEVEPHENIMSRKWGLPGRRGRGCTIFL
jgi:hypothetical protein